MYFLVKKITFSCLAFMLFVFIYAEPITLNISNRSNVIFTGARIKLKATNKWIELGTINLGVNKFNLEEDTGVLNNLRGLIEITEPNGQTMIKNINKTQNDKTILVEINKNTSDNAEKLLSNSAIVNTIPLTNFYDIPDNLKDYSWSAYCSLEPDGIGYIMCEINSNPKICYMGVGGAIGVSIAKLEGAWSASIDPVSLSKLPESDWGILGFLSVRIWANFGGFFGSGLVVGSGGGRGRYTIEDSAKPCLY